MFSFEGDFRRKPVQNLGGHSRHNQRENLLHKAHLERMKREEHRRQVQSAVKIQAFFRGFRTRTLQRANQRQEFENIQKTSKIVDTRSIGILMTKLNFFYEKKTDSAKLAWLMPHVIKNAAAIMKNCRESENNVSWAYRCAKFLHITLRNIEHVIKTENNEARDPLGPHWRLLEIFLSCKSWQTALGNEHGQKAFMFITGILARSQYFSQLKFIMNRKIPPLMETTTRAPTPLAGCLFQLLVEPLALVSSPATPASFKSLILNQFLTHFASQPFSDQIFFYVLPSLATETVNFPLSELFDTIDTDSKVHGNPWTLYAVLLLSTRSALQDASLLAGFVSCLARLTPCLRGLQRGNGFDEDLSDEDFDEDEEELRDAAEQDVLQRSIDVLNEFPTVQLLVNSVGQYSKAVPNLCSVAHDLLVSQRLALHNYRLLYTLAFKSSFLSKLWQYIKSEKQVSLFGQSDTLLIQLLARGMTLSTEESNRLVPALDVFCSLFSHLLVTLDDVEFYAETVGLRGGMPFSLEDLVDMAVILRDVCLGLVELAYPESRSSAATRVASGTNKLELNAEDWVHLFKATVNVVRQLHSRDTRRRFCPLWVWVSNRIALPTDRSVQLPLRNARSQRPFRAAKTVTRNDMEDAGGVLLSTRMVRTLAVLRDIPFIFSFTERVRMWQQWITTDKAQNQGEAVHFLQGPAINVLIRRNYIYEDAFDKLSPENEPNLKLKMRVQLTNAVGLDEAGIDGGGIFREFLSELLKTSFDPNRGFFRLTHDNLLYPSPAVASLVPDFPKHYFFIGRMLGKALYENLLVELPLADFFLSKILGDASASLDVHHLASLDPVLHKNLLYLRHYEGDVTDLGLDFTVVNSELGETKVEELKANGSSIPVTTANRIEYIHLMADYKLNKQIRLQCQAFRQGLASVVDLDWLQTFSYRELQILISGAQIPVDVEDLRANTQYSGGYAADHPVIQNFWKVVSALSDGQKRQLLKFVTSCSRPPLLGFKDLDPPFTVQNAGPDDRLPTASTCMNLLKLPQFHDETTLKTKLLYALESGAGFELS